MTILHTVLIAVHVILGAVVVLLFWGPVFARKGGGRHVLWGRYYLWGMYLATASGALLSIVALWGDWRFAGRTADPAAASPVFSPYLFLLYLSLMTFTMLHHGVAVLRARQDRAQLRSVGLLTWPALLSLTGLALLVFGVLEGGVLNTVFGGLGVGLGLSMLRYCLRRSVPPGEWRVEHLGAMIGSGIAAYTAFVTFGGRALIPTGGDVQLLFWIAPSVLGGMSIAVLSRRYRLQNRSIRRE